MPRILVLDVDLKELGFIEEMLQDSGFSAITCTSVVEAIPLLTTGFFDVFVAIDRPAQSHTGATLSALATARVHCKSFFCWRVDNIKQQCGEFIGQVVKGELSADHRNHYTAFPPPREVDVPGQQSSGATA
jgi:hypothetical protein